MKKLIDSIIKLENKLKKFFFGNKAQKAVVVAEVVKEVQKVAPKKPVTRKKKQ